MKKIIVSIIALLMLSSCDSKLNKMEQDARKYVETFIFKKNYTSNILEYKTIGYEEINENVFDTAKAMAMQPDYSRLVSLYTYYLKLYQTTESQLYLREAKNYGDSADLVHKYISDTLSNWRFEPKKMYRYTAHMKAIFTNGNGTTENYLDTLYIYFDENLNIKPLR